jgi:hypothetical protein
MDRKIKDSIHDVENAAHGKTISVEMDQSYIEYEQEEKVKKDIK